VDEGIAVHDVAQHTPVTQKLLMHCVPTVQEAPRGESVVVVVELAVVAVVVVGIVVVTISGAQTIFCALGVS